MCLYLPGVAGHSRLNLVATSRIMVRGDSGDVTKTGAVRRKFSRIGCHAL
jgi:hypothetical protein